MDVLVRTSAILAIGSCLVAGTAAAQPTVTIAHQSTLDQQVEAILPRFKDPDWHGRSAAFEALVRLALPGGLHGRVFLLSSSLATLLRNSPKEAESVRLALIRLLERENVRAAQGNYGEDYSDYRVNVLAAVATLDDPRALNGLLSNLGTGGIVEDGVARLGTVALPRIIAVSDGRDDTMRLSAVRILCKMLQQRAVPGASNNVSIESVKPALMRAVRSDSFRVRLSAIEGLALIPGPDVTMVLEGLAANDPYSRTSGPRGVPVYPVREAARKVLQTRQR